MHWVVTAPSGARLRPIDPIRKAGLPAFLQHSAPDPADPQSSANGETRGLESGAQNPAMKILLADDDSLIINRQ